MTKVLEVSEDLIGDRVVFSEYRFGRSLKDDLERRRLGGGREVRKFWRKLGGRRSWCNVGNSLRERGIMRRRRDRS